ncbi:MAG: hypothetical protein KAY32_09425 [Candidatus Eisenbacteria sp.]|nr:hypothetical protein [Candidatus Eisenbacteria bacterium]
MMKAATIAGATVLLILAGAVVLAQSVPDKTPQSPAATGSQTPDDLNRNAPFPPLFAASPLHQRIQATLDREAEALAVILERLDQTDNDRDVLQLQREAEALKLAAEIEILTLQAEFAREQDRHEQAERIDTAIARLQDPIIPASREGAVGTPKEAGRSEP